jgi:hypothetical protein
MECKQIRLEYPNIKFKECYPSCHEDDEMGFGPDLWVTIEGKDRNCCCAIMNSFTNHDIKRTLR